MSLRGGEADEAISYYHSDHLGSSSVITDKDGNEIQRIEYLPFGKTAVSAGTDTVTHKYTGKELDAATGLYYYGARYYDAELGRFITPDTIIQSPFDPQTFNRYTYVRNNPIKYIDPSGHFFGLIIGAIIAIVKAAAAAAIAHPIIAGAIVGAVSGGVQAGRNGGNIAKGIIIGGIMGGLAGATLGSSASGWLKLSAGLSLGSQVAGAMPGEIWGNISKGMGYASAAVGAGYTVWNFAKSVKSWGRIAKLDKSLGQEVSRLSEAGQTANSMQLKIMKGLKEITKMTKKALAVKPITTIVGGLIGGVIGGASSDWDAEAIGKGAIAGGAFGYAFSGTRIGFPKDTFFGLKEIRFNPPGAIGVIAVETKIYGINVIGPVGFTGEWMNSEGFRPATTTPIDSREVSWGNWV